MTDPAPFPSERCAGEPAFALDRTHALVADPGMADERVRRHLEHAILRDPHDLRAHVQRIGVAIDHRDASHARDALIDLHLALGAQGQALRERMRTLAQPALRAQVFATPAGGVVLQRGLTGKLDLVTRSHAARDAADPLHEARELVLHGDLDGALDMLEAAQRSHPSRADLAREYAALCDHPALAARRDAFLAVPAAGVTQGEAH